MGGSLGPTRAALYRHLEEGKQEREANLSLFNLSFMGIPGKVLGASLIDGDGVLTRCASSWVSEALVLFAFPFASWLRISSTFASSCVRSIQAGPKKLRTPTISSVSPYLLDLRMAPMNARETFRNQKFSARVIAWTMSWCPHFAAT